MTKRGCDNCEVVTINGVATHEIGCPNSWIHPFTGKPYEKECEECGLDFEPRSRFDPICEGCAENDDDFDIFD